MFATNLLNATKAHMLDKWRFRNSIVGLCVLAVSASFDGESHAPAAVLAWATRRSTLVPEEHLRSLNLHGLLLEVAVVRMNSVQIAAWRTSVSIEVAGVSKLHIVAFT